MRIWSLHPKYLDTKGLVALWRETLLAKHVLEGKTKGYKNHPQLNRFKNTNHPIDNINHYLSIVFKVSSERQFSFNKDKISWEFKRELLAVTDGQLNYEFKHLLNKLKVRDASKYKMLKKLDRIEPHPLFKIIHGNIEEWEIIS
jgi:hypothetical protein